MCFHNSTFASRTSINPLVSDQLPAQISIENDLPDSSEALELDILNESTKYNLKRGVPLILPSNNVVRQGELTWSREQPLFASFSLDIPSTEQKLYWSIRGDGIYRSFNNVRFVKEAGWTERR
ncbi:hypothetical protein QL285_054879 [Trifolium repens]|jgi:hypothetical protein|nr:hypothetical protein QL285_054879 [Trifolium repens]